MKDPQHTFPPTRSLTRLARARISCSKGGTTSWGDRFRCLTNGQSSDLRLRHSEYLPSVGSFWPPALCHLAGTTPVARVQDIARYRVGCSMRSTSTCNASDFPRAQARGFTLIELMVTVAVLAIISAIALPSFREVIIRMTVTSTTNELVGAVNLARMEAVKRGTDVVVKSASGGSDWSGGWSVADGAEVIRAYPAVKANYSVHGIAGANGNDKELALNPRGDLGAVAGFNIAVCRPDGKADQARSVEVAGSGVVTTKVGVTGSACN